MAKKEQTANFIQNPIVMLVLVVLLVIAAFAIGSLWSKVQTYEKIGGQIADSGTGGENGAPTPTPDDSKVDVSLSDDDFVRGDSNAKIVLIEYSDLECPYCARFHPTAQQAIQEFDGQLAWVYRHFPLDSIHPDARKLAEATECAAEQGGNDAFWGMIDGIYEAGPEIENINVVAGQLGLDVNALNECLDSGKMAENVQNDYQSGLTAGVRGTPGNILLNTETGDTLVVPGAVPFETLQQNINQMLQ